ncbi:MAG: hypothetical protein KKA42_04080, partial [candidate division Zixibacteria bacterium]|nr:hypothetical protein [candidate division Zixibacteria bacterium]
DYYWNTVKGLMEEEYQRFRRLNTFTMPGKYHLYLCPCPLYSVIWDSRFGTSIDPTRGTIFTLYTPDINTAWPMVITQSAILRNYGYAPAFLTEGFASYLSFALYDMKKFREQGKAQPITDFIATREYMAADPILADRTSATFVRYLIEQYQVPSFLDLYKRADDLNLGTAIEETYGKPLADLEREWEMYLDTITFKPAQARYYGSQAEAMREYDIMRDYAHLMLSLVATREDSLAALALVIRADFSVGDYASAARLQSLMISSDSSRGDLRMTRAAYRMMNGEYDSALADLQEAQRLDSTDVLATFNLALYNRNKGEVARARALLTNVILDPAAAGAAIESRVMLADILALSDDDAYRSEAVTYYEEVVSDLERVIGQETGNPLPTQYMWLGAAYLGLADLPRARQSLDMTLFLESRAFYVGYTELLLGKVADLEGRHAEAREHYGRVLAQPSADYHQQEARKYLETPFRQ